MKKLLFFTLKLLLLSIFIIVFSHIYTLFWPFRALDWSYVRGIYRYTTLFICCFLGLIILRELSPDLKKQKVIIMIILFTLVVFLFDWPRFVDRAINDRSEIVEKTSTQILCSKEELGNRRICDSKIDVETVFLEDSDTLVIRHFYLDGVIPEFESIWGRNPMSVRLEETSLGTPPEQLVEIRIDFKEDISLENTEIDFRRLMLRGYEIPIE